MEPPRCPGKRENLYSGYYKVVFIGRGFKFVFGYVRNGNSKFYSACLVTRPMMGLPEDWNRVDNWKYLSMVQFPKPS
jgi:hypothetical protein